METGRISTCTDLRAGDVIQARVRGMPQFTGRVVEIHETQELLWALDNTGVRRLIDLGSYDVYRAAPPYL
jgi:hypothetical protein